MKFLDFHCDTAGRIFYENQKLKKNNCSVDIEKLKKGGCLAQVFAFFVDQKINKDPYDEFLKLYNNFINEISENTDKIKIVKNIKELKQAENEGKTGAFMSIEEGEVIKGDMNLLHDIYNKGIRIITLLWNYKNQLGFPNCEPQFMNKELTEKGIETVHECEKLGIILDASHLSDGGFYTLSRECRGPFIASHSDARAVTGHPRNLTDDMIRMLSNKGGVMGLNFCSKFLNDRHDDFSKIEDIVKHALYIRNTGGIDVMALGSDFDGIENKVEIENSSEFYKLYDALNKNGFSEDEIDKIFYKNAERVIEEVMK